jgi:hypothetical protein
MLTALARKKELRDKVDVNFSGRVSFLEILLHQYRAFCSPADFCARSMQQTEEHPEVSRARLMLEEVNSAVLAFEGEKTRLTVAAEKPGVRALAAKHTLAQLNHSPLADKLSVSLIKAQAAVRRATAVFGGSSTEGSAATTSAQAGTLFWMLEDLKQKQARYGRRAN